MNNLKRYLIYSLTIILGLLQSSCILSGSVGLDTPVVKVESKKSHHEKEDDDHDRERKKEHHDKKEHEEDD